VAAFGLKIGRKRWTPKSTKALDFSNSRVFPGLSQNQVSLRKCWFESDRGHHFRASLRFAQKPNCPSPNALMPSGLRAHRILCRVSGKGTVFSADSDHPCNSPSFFRNVPSSASTSSMLGDSSSNRSPSVALMDCTCAVGAADALP
jgi:hypothetical protein